MAKENEYPRMVYHEDGSNKIVYSEKEENDLGGEWLRDPTDASKAAQVATPARVDPSGNEPLVEMLLTRMAERFPSLAGVASDDASEPPKRGPGRPPKNPEPAPASGTSLSAAGLAEPPVTAKKDNANG